MATALSSDTSDSDSVDFATIDFEKIPGLGEEKVPQIGMKRPHSSASESNAGNGDQSFHHNLGLDTKRTKSAPDQPLTGSNAEISKNRRDFNVHITHHVCTECGTQFNTSYFLKSLRLEICDECKEKEKYKLITVSDVRQKYHLTDRHLRDESTGKLSCIEKRNPFNSGWSRMKLYLEFQVKEKACAVWGGEGGIDKETHRRRELSHKLKRNKYAKELKEMKASVKIESATFRTPFHEHSYGSEGQVDPESDEYQKTCTICGFVLTYEKL